MACPRSLALNKLVKDNEMLSEVEVASVVAPLLQQLHALHALGEAHGNVSLATVTIRVIEPADGTIHLPDAGCCDEAAHRPCAACQQSAEGASAAADIWSVGVVAVFDSVLQCAAVCCSVLQCVAVCCTVLQRFAACCSVLRQTSGASAPSPCSFCWPARLTRVTKLQS
jgi:hypothetical protein